MSLVEAAGVLNRRPGTLREWLREGLTKPGRGRRRGDHVSLEDLVSLEVVRRLRAAGVALPRVRVLEVALRRMFPDTPRPFAHRVFFLHGASVWLDLAGDDPALLGLVELRDGEPVWVGTLEGLADRLEHDDEGAVRSWDPGGGGRLKDRRVNGTP